MNLSEKVETEYTNMLNINSCLSKKREVKIYDLDQHNFQTTKASKIVRNQNSNPFNQILKRVNWTSSSSTSRDFTMKLLKRMNKNWKISKQSSGRKTSPTLPNIVNPKQQRNTSNGGSQSVLNVEECLILDGNCINLDSRVLSTNGKHVKKTEKILENLCTDLHNDRETESNIINLELTISEDENSPTNMNVTSMTDAVTNNNSLPMEQLTIDITDDIICIEDSVVNCTSTSLNVSDDSDVIFVSQEPSSFVPLTSNKPKRKKQFLFDITRSKKQQLKNSPEGKRRKSILTSSEKRQLDLYNNNTYNPLPKDSKTNVGKRKIIVDGSNVAFSHSLNKEFSVKGLRICLEHFQQKGHTVKAVVPQFRLGKNKSSDPEGLEALHREGKIVLTPSKNLPGASSSSYDDRFILQLACELDAAIVSNDNYRDLMDENTAFKKFIRNRVIGYSWCDDIFILPKDPYGRFGPMLDSILNY